MDVAILWERVTRPVLQAIEELAGTSMIQVLNLLDVNEVSQSQTQSPTKWGSVDSKTGGWTSTRAYKQVAMAKLDLNKTQAFLAAAKGYKTREDDHTGCWGRAPTLGRIHNGLYMIHGPLGQNKMAQHHGQKTSRSK